MPRRAPSAVRHGVPSTGVADGDADVLVLGSLIAPVASRHAAFSDRPASRARRRVGGAARRGPGSRWSSIRVRQRRWGFLLDDRRLRAVPWEAFVDAVRGAAGRRRGGRRRRWLGTRSRRRWRGGWRASSAARPRMVGLLGASSRVDCSWLAGYGPTGSYARFVSRTAARRGDGDRAASCCPNQAVLILAPAMGACDRSTSAGRPR